MTTWWQQHNDLIDSGEYPDGERLAPHLVELLTDVEHRFQAADGESLAWADPHAVPGDPFARRDTEDDEYSRVTNPGKYRILDVRVRAWLDALTALDLAGARSQSGSTAMDFDVHWPGSGTRPPTQIVTVTPSVEAPVMHLAAWREDGKPPQDAFVSYEVGVDAAPLVVLTTPGCGCDACDSGSADLLEELDRWLLSIVDGSFRVELGPTYQDVVTSFGAECRPVDPSETQRAVIGRSWWAGRTSRALVSPVRPML